MYFSVLLKRMTYVMNICTITNAHAYAFTHTFVRYNTILYRLCLSICIQFKTSKVIQKYNHVNSFKSTHIFLECIRCYNSYNNNYNIICMCVKFLTRKMNDNKPCHQQTIMNNYE